MSSANAAEQRELVYCHECENEFWKDEHGLVCPACRSDFTEVIEQAHDPREEDESPPPIFHPFHNHSPWQNHEDVPDPEEGDVRRYEYRSQNGGFSFSTTFVSSSGPGPGQPRGRDTSRDEPPDPFTLLGQVLGGMAQPQHFPHQQRPAPPNAARPSSSSDGTRTQPQPFSNGQSFIFTRGTPHNHTGEDGAIPHSELHNMLGTLFSSFQGNAPPHGQQGTNLQMLLQAMLNPANARHGDAVYSNEAFDRVLSQFMDEHQSSNAPGPASEAAIAALPRKVASKSELGDEGKAECSICMDTVTKGVEISVLPCHHWFHPDCIKAWLSEHDTCPVCRAGITPKDGDQDTARTSDQAPLHNHDPANVARRQSGSELNPFIIPESPSRERRQPGARRHSGGISSNNTPGAFPSDDGSESGGRSSQGGISGRMRSFFGSSGSGGDSPRRDGRRSS